MIFQQRLRNAKRMRPVRARYYRLLTPDGYNHGAVKRGAKEWSYYDYRHGATHSTNQVENFWRHFKAATYPVFRLRRPAGRRRECAQMGWDTYRYALRCSGCGRTGTEIVRENDWMQRETSFEGFDYKAVKDPRPSRYEEPPYEFPVCPDCGEGVSVHRLPDRE